MIDHLILGRTCGAVWTFERYIDYELEGFVRDVQTEISKTECEDLCLSESRWANFDLDWIIHWKLFPQQLWVVCQLSSTTLGCLSNLFPSKVFLSICYLWPSDEGVSIERRRQVAIEKQIWTKRGFSRARQIINNFASILIWTQSCSDSVNREPTEWNKDQTTWKTSVNHVSTHLLCYTCDIQV